MSVKLKKVSEKEFKTLCCPILFGDDVYNRQFGIITNGKQEFGLAWRSDIIEPILLEIESGIICIGIDQNFTIIDSVKSKILVNLNLVYNFLDAKIYKTEIFIITELNIIKLNKNTLHKLAEYDLPDIFDNIIFEDNKIIVKCAEDTSIII